MVLVRTTLNKWLVRMSLTLSEGMVGCSGTADMALISTGE